MLKQRISWLNPLLSYLRDSSPQDHWNPIVVGTKSERVILNMAVDITPRFIRGRVVAIWEGREVSSLKYLEVGEKQDTSPVRITGQIPTGIAMSKREGVRLTTATVERTKDGNTTAARLSRADSAGKLVESSLFKSEGGLDAIPHNNGRNLLLDVIADLGRGRADKRRERRQRIPLV